MSFTKTLRTLLAENDLLIAPGVFDGLSALLAKQAGFKILYASGGAIARSMGYPDIGLVTMTEMLRALAVIVDASELPIIADADTGFGNNLNVRRMVHEYERIGVAGLHIEDQTFPKRCGHLHDKSLISKDEMMAKIMAASEARKDSDFLLIARTDAIAVEGFEAAIERAQAYLQVGADMIFIEAPETIEQVVRIAEFIPQPKLINMFSGGKTPLVAIDELKKLGYQIVIIPSDLQRAAIFAMQKTLQMIAADGNSAKMEAALTSFNEREKIIGTAKYFAWDQEVVKKSLLK